MRKDIGVPLIVSGMRHSLRIEGPLKWRFRRSLSGQCSGRTFPAKEEAANGTALLSTGTSKSGVQYKGLVEIPNLSDENSVDEVEVCAS